MHRPLQIFFHPSSIYSALSYSFRIFSPQPLHITYMTPARVQLSKRLHYKPSPAMHAQDSHDEHPPGLPSYTAVTVQYAYTGRILLEAVTAEEMRDYQLQDCTVSAVAVAADIPRILVQLLWRPTGIRTFTVCFTPASSTAWLETTNVDYNYRFDHTSPRMDAYVPLLAHGSLACLCCGDETDDVDETSTTSREDVCERCEPDAICEACRCEINGTPVCLRCVLTEEIPLISERAQRRHSTFMQKAESPLRE